MGVVVVWCASKVRWGADTVVWGEDKDGGRCTCNEGGLEGDDEDGS